MISLQCQLETAIRLATQYHSGQKDKAGKPYILHPLWVMNKVNSIEAKIVAVLHDVLEDTSLTKDDLIAHEFNEDIVNAIELLTKSKNQSYESYIENISKNKLATEVKMADLLHNMDLTRLKDITFKDLTRSQKYMKAYNQLETSLREHDIHEEKQTRIKSI